MLSTTHPALWLEMHEQRVARASARFVRQADPQPKAKPKANDRLRSPIGGQLVGAEQR